MLAGRIGTISGRWTAPIPPRSRLPTSNNLSISFFRFTNFRFINKPIFGALWLWLMTCNVAAQLINGQFFTNGLAISNSPLPNQSFNAGGNIPVSVEVSGDGKIPQAASSPNSDLQTAFISLSIFLTSAQLGLNATITSDGTFLAGEPGSTVKHLSYAIPSCIPTGSYNFTYYEVSRINGKEFFSITPIPITIQNAQPGQSSSTCPGVVFAQSNPPPQVQAPIGFNAFLQAGFSLNTAAPPGPTPTVIANQGGSSAGNGKASAQPEVVTSVITLAGGKVTTVTMLVGSTVTTTARGGVATVTVEGGGSKKADTAILFPVNGALGAGRGSVGHAVKAAILAAAAMTLLV